MTAQTMTLAELVNRGMIAMAESGNQIQQLKTVQAHDGHVRRYQPRQRSMEDVPEESARILGCADRLAQKIKSLHNAPSDPLTMRKYILNSVQLFLSDITSGAPSRDYR